MGEQSTADAVKQVVVKYFLIIGLATVIPLGLIFPSPGSFLSSFHFGFVNATKVAITIIFFVSGISLGSLKECLELKALGVALLLILALTPALAVPVLMLRDASLLAPHLAHGMAIFCAVPTTLSSGVVMVTQAHGNTGLAILITMAANTLGTLTMPMSAYYIFKSSTQVDAWPIFVDLCIMMLLPLLVGIMVQKSVPAVPGFVKEQKTKLTLLNNSCIIFCVWLTASAAHSEILKTHITVLCLLVFMGVLLHVVKLVVAFGTSSLIGFPAREHRTLILMCSQKSLPVSISLIAALPAALQPYAGLMAIPCVVGHATQLFMDAVLVSRWSGEPTEDAKMPLLSNPQDDAVIEKAS